MFQARFHKAMELVGAEFIDRVKYYGTSWWPARELVVEAINKRESVSFNFDWDIEMNYILSCCC